MKMKFSFPIQFFLNTIQSKYRSELKMKLLFCVTLSFLLNDFEVGSGAVDLVKKFEKASVMNRTCFKTSTGKSRLKDEHYCQCV